MRKLSFDEAITALAEEHPLKASDIRASVLKRYVWLMMYSAPGCLPDHSEVCTTKRAALDSARFLYADDAPRGFITTLRNSNIAATDDNGYYRVQLSRVRVWELF